MLSLLYLALAASAAPMRYGNIAFFGAASALCWALRRPPRARLRTALPRSPGSAAWDWAAIGFFCAMATWLMYQTLSARGAELLVNAKVHGDFGPHLAIVQNFVWGHNFPTEYPFFAGPPISYHFLFYFQVANLHYLGLALAHSLNLLSILSLVGMLVLVTALGEVAFASRAVGRIAGALFFFPSTIAYLTFLPAQGSPGALIEKLLTTTEYIHSGLPLENWGLWTMNVYANQRHFASAIGVLLIALIFLLDSYRRSPTPERADDAAAPAAAADSPRGSLDGFLFSGLLLGSLLLWNSPTFISAIAVLGSFLILFPHRLKLLGLAAVAAACSLPQLLYLRHASSASGTYPHVHHPIRMAGRKVFFAWPVYAWSAGYPTQERQEVFTEMLESRDPERVFELLQQNRIAYVAIDEGLRHGDFVKSLNEEVYEKFFPRAFEDTNKRYDSLVIYAVPSRDDWAARQSRESG